MHLDCFGHYIFVLKNIAGNLRNDEKSTASRYFLLLAGTNGISGQILKNLYSLYLIVGSLNFHILY